MGWWWSNDAVNMLSGVLVGVILSNRNTTLLHELKRIGVENIFSLTHVAFEAMPEDCRMDGVLQAQNYTPTLKSISTTASHLKALRIACRKSPQGTPFIILEDDAMLEYVPYWNRPLLEELRALPTEWGAFNMGTSFSLYSHLPSQSQVLNWSSRLWGIYAVAYNPAVACGVRDVLRCAPADHAIYASMPSFVAWPPLFGHDYSLPSTVQAPRVTDFTHFRGRAHEAHVRRFWFRSTRLRRSEL